MSQKNTSVHQFHIPVMGTAFTIDTPLKVGRFGVSSVISIVDDDLCETMRAFYAEKHQLPYEPILKYSDDFRARRITAYLNVVNELLKRQVKALKKESFEKNADITKYFEMLSDESELKTQYNKMINETDDAKKKGLQDALRTQIVQGRIDVNIMTKIDRDNFTKEGVALPSKYSDAQASLRGFANSDLESNVIFSAGFNRRLYAHCAEYPDFYPDENGYTKKGIILKVSDYRSSVIQGRFFAQKGLWIKEHRIESGLNCGGHAFATEGYLLGPILEEFKENKKTLFTDLYALCNKSLEKLESTIYNVQPDSVVTVQGGIGTSQEKQVLMDYYNVDGTGWGSPFLLVPEATTLDQETRYLLSQAKEKDFYLSDISPLGVPFNTVKGTDSEAQRLERAESGKPGSPCPKGFLVSNVEFSKKPICRASRFYQKRKIESETQGQEIETDTYEKIIEKTCLCEDLAASALSENGIDNKRPLKTVVCPGPNLAFFSQMATLKEMVNHIYGRVNILTAENRPNMFINELRMYIEFIEKEIKESLPDLNAKKKRYLNQFKENLLKGIDYYKKSVPKIVTEGTAYRENMKAALSRFSEELDTIVKTYKDVFESQIVPEPAL